MNVYWHTIGEYFWRPEVPYVLGLASVLALICWRFLASERRLVAHTVGFFVLCVAGQFGAAVIEALEFRVGASTMHELFVLGSGLALIRLSGLFVFRVLLPALGLRTPRILEDILVILAYVALGMVRLRMSGVDLSGIVATSAVITAVIAFSMQDTFGNILGGLALQLDSSISIGDWVRVDDVSGRVADIRWRYTAVVTRNGETAVIPNSLLMKSKFFVIGERQVSGLRWRRWVWFNVGYDTQPWRVVELVERATAEVEIPNVLKEPPPDCVLMEFGSGFGRYALRYWLSDPQPDDATDAAVRAHVIAALQRAGIRLAVPEERRYVTKENLAYRQAVTERELSRRLRALRGVEIFSVLSEREVKAMAERLVYAPFARGDLVTHQGAVAHWLYILVSGEAGIFLDSPLGDRRLLTSLAAGSVFGEMGLMTGEPRRATVIAKTDAECYRLDKAGFEDIIRSRPEIAEQMSHILATRGQQLEAARDQLKAQTSEGEHAQRRDDILARMRSFFGLQ